MLPFNCVKEILEYFYRSLENLIKVVFFMAYSSFLLKKHKGNRCEFSLSHLHLPFPKRPSNFSSVEPLQLVFFLSNANCFEVFSAPWYEQYVRLFVTNLFAVVSWWPFSTPQIVWQYTKRPGEKKSLAFVRPHRSQLAMRNIRINKFYCSRAISSTFPSRHRYMATTTRRTITDK